MKTGRKCPACAANLHQTKVQLSKRTQNIGYCRRCGWNQAHPFTEDELDFLLYAAGHGAAILPKLMDMKTTASPAPPAQQAAAQGPQDKLEADYARLRTRCIQLEKALAPFAACQVKSFGSVPDEDAYLWKPTQTNQDLPGISIAHIKAAKAALPPLPPLPPL